MMRGRLLAAIAALLACACVNFDETRQKYCESVAPETRAEICQDGPQVIAFDPPRNATNIALDARITVTFDQAVECDAAGISLKQNDAPVSGTTTCPPGAMKAIFTPAGALFTGRVYKVTVTSTVRNELHIPALPLSWTFTTR